MKLSTYKQANDVTVIEALIPGSRKPVTAWIRKGRNTFNLYTKDSWGTMRIPESYATHDLALASFMRRAIIEAHN